MIRILITEAAFAAVASTIASSLTESQREVEAGAGRFGDTPAGMVAIFLPQPALDGLSAMRGPGESYSDAILRAVGLEGRHG
jgi:hypothetical protein